MKPSVVRTGRATKAQNRAVFGPTPEGACVLDVGAGDSPFTSELAGTSSLSVSVDPDYAREPIAGVPAVAAVGAALPFPDHVFDEVHASYVLMHLDERQRVLMEIARVTAIDGRICISPVWPRRSRRQPPGLHVVPGARRPRRRPSAVLRPWASPGALATPALEVAARIAAPPRPVRWVGSIAMRLVIRRNGTPRIDTQRVWADLATGRRT